MTLVKKLAAGALAACLYSESAPAAHPPLDRPTPPPCCADGICYPNVQTWGVYSTRWRRWPTEGLQPIPAAPTPGERLGPDIPPYETPSVEDEDRRAPPPSKSPAEETEQEVETPGTTPVTRPAVPAPQSGMEPAPSTEQPTTPSVRPFTSPLAPPTPPSTTPAPGTRMPWENNEEPTGDWDPPPAPPTATAVTIDRALPPSNRLETLRQQSQPQQRPAVPANDPPPMLPVSLASATY